MAFRPPLALACLALLVPGRVQAGSTRALATASVTILDPAAALELEESGSELVSARINGDLAAGAGSPPGEFTLRPTAYRVAGRSGAAFALALPDPEQSALTAPGARLPIQGFRVSVAGEAATGHPAGMVLDGEGRQDFQFGVTLRVPHGQPRALYRGRINLTMAYN
jgi:hypothetical protein